MECFSWDRLKKVTNLADYDVVILDLLSLQGPRDLDVPVFRKMLDIRTAQQVLSKTDGALFVLGDPRFTIKWESDRAKHEEPFLGWTGIEFFWDDRPGTTVEREWQVNRDLFKPFAGKLVRWYYSLVTCRPYPEEFSKVWDIKAMRANEAEPTVLVNKILKNSYNNALVFSVIYAVEYFPDRNARFLGSKSTEELSGPIFFLPASSLSEAETLEFVLRDICGLDVSAPEPEWVSEFVAPGQERVDRELAELQDRIERLLEEHDRKAEDRAEARKPLKLLYETGAALEEAVWSVLEALGAEVERPEDRTKEDGWITVQIGNETFNGVLEVKGVKSKHFSLEGLRQLTDWRERGMMLREKTYHGVFVGNSSIEDPPRRRLWPFNKNWVEQAEMRGYAAIRTEDLYILYLLDRTGRIDRDEFWRQLFSTTGPFNMQLYREKLTDEEKGQLENLPQA